MLSTDGAGSCGRLPKYALLSCEVEKHKGQKMYLNQYPTNSKTMIMKMKYSTMNVQIYEEYEVQEFTLFHRHYTF